MSVYRLLKQVAQALKPTQAVHETLNEVLAQINKQLQLRELQAQATPGGSVAKNTFLRSSHDVDVFVRFAHSYEDEDLSDLLENALSTYKPRRVHGSRDYFLFDYRGYTFEVVPVLAITSAQQARNVTDASPLHVMYFKKRGVGLEDEVRLAKQFAKAAGVYGAESYLRGFSGHVLDLLIIHHQSCYELVKAAARWQAPVVIDLEEHHQNPLVVIDSSKHGPLLLVDPIQPQRNAAAALSQEQFAAFRVRCQEFLEAPSVEFFKIPEFSVEQVQKRVHNKPSLVLLLTPPSDDKTDVAGSRVRKFFERLRDEFIRAGFTLEEADWHFEEDEPSTAWFVFAEEELPAVEEREGPPITQEEHAKRFREEHADVVEKQGRLYAPVPREITTPKQFLEAHGPSISQQTRVEYAHAQPLKR